MVKMQNCHGDFVELTQYLPPNGKKKKCFAKVGKRYVDMAKDMELSCEILGTGEIALYANYKDDPPENEGLELANNGPGKNSPKNKLKELIYRKYQDRHE